MKNLKKVLIYLLIGGFIFYIALSFYGNIKEIKEISVEFNWFILPLLLFFAYLNYVVRFIRWHYYLKILGFRGVFLKNSYLIFNSGLMLSITPGKIGELFKSYLLKKSENIPMSETVSIVFAERFTDFVAVLILSIFGMLMFNFGYKIFWFGIAFIFLFIFIIIWRKPLVIILSFFERFNIFKNITKKLEKIFLSLFKTLKPIPLVISTFLGILAWGCEAVSFYFLIKFLPHYTLSLNVAIFIYSISTIAGALSMLPGGIVATEGLMLFLLLKLNVFKARATGVFATIVIRITTLWFAVLVGFVSFLIWRKVNHQKINLSAVDIQKN